MSQVDSKDMVMALAKGYEAIEHAPLKHHIDRAGKILHGTNSDIFVVLENGGSSFPSFPWTACPLEYRPGSEDALLLGQASLFVCGSEAFRALTVTLLVLIGLFLILCVMGALAYSVWRLLRPVLRHTSSIFEYCVAVLFVFLTGVYLAATVLNRLLDACIWADRHLGDRLTASSPPIVVFFVFCMLVALGYAVWLLFRPLVLHLVDRTKVMPQRVTDRLTYLFAVVFLFPITTYLAALVSDYWLGRWHFTDSFIGRCIGLRLFAAFLLAVTFFVLCMVGALFYSVRRLVHPTIPLSVNNCV